MNYIYGSDVYNTLVAYQKEFIGTFVMISREGRRTRSFGKVANIDVKDDRVEVWFGSFIEQGFQDGCYVHRNDDKAWMRVVDPKEQEQCEVIDIFKKIKGE